MLNYYFIHSVELNMAAGLQIAPNRIDNIRTDRTRLETCYRQ